MEAGRKEGGRHEGRKGEGGGGGRKEGLKTHSSTMIP